VVARDAWQLAVQHLVDATATMLGLWGDKDAVHLALLEEPSGEIGVVTIECPDGKFPSVAARHPAANRLERAIASLYGLKPIGAPDNRPWLDLGFWDVTQPLARRRNRGSRRALTSFCRLRATTCIRSRSARSMPASSSPDISASPPTARRLRGSSSGSAMYIRGSSR